MAGGQEVMGVLEQQHHRLGQESEHQKSNTRLEPMSLPNSDLSTSSSRSSSSSSRSTSSSNVYDDEDVVDTGRESSSPEPKNATIKCSAVHALERDMPDEDYSHLIVELRRLILEDNQQRPGVYATKDIERCKQDDWTLARFLLRHKLNLDLAFDMLKATLRFRHESIVASLRPQDFPQEFFQLGGCFVYEPDRKANKTLYLRVGVHRKTPEIAAVVHGFLTFQTLRCDEEARGRGIAIIIDCTGGGLQSADMDLLAYLIWMLKNYFPKGLSYFLVHNLPWILKPFWHLAKVWIPDEHRELIKFSNQKTIFEYIDREALPDFMGGTCGRNYREVPENCTSIAEATKLWGIEKKVALRILEKFEENLPAESVAKARKFLTSSEWNQTAATTTKDEADSGNEHDNEADDDADDDNQSYHSSASSMDVTST